MNLNIIAQAIHEQNVAVGWWDNPRPIHTFISLFHSEVTEALEGDRKNLMDDHLPNYPMFWVELADYVIRLLDFAGSRRYDLDYYYNKFPVIEVSPATDNTHLTAILHSQTSALYESLLMVTVHEPAYLLAQAIHICFTHAEAHSVDLLQIINEKVEYNQTRADHKRENRAKAGGKVY